MNSKVLLTGIGIIAATCGLGFSFYRNYKQQSNWKPPQRQRIAQLLIGLREAMYPALMQVTQIVQTQLQALNLQITPPEMLEQLKALIMSDQCPTGIKIKRIFKEVHRQISEEDMQKAVQKYYSDDPQIQFHKKAFQEQFQKAFLGVQPDLKTQMPVFVHKQKILTIVKLLLTQKIARIRKEYQLRKNISQEFLEKDIQTDEIVRKEQIKKIGFKQVKDQTRMFQFCIAKYLQMDQSFAKEYQQLVRQYKQSIATYFSLQQN